MAVPIGIAAIVSSYLIGSIPSAYMIGRIWRGIDLRQEGDGHISATALHRNIGRLPFALALIMDLSKGVLSLYVASMLTDSQLILVISAYAAVIGHCWSIYLGFKGGLGGAITFSVLATLGTVEAFIGAGISLVILFSTRKSSWATYALLISTAAVLLITSRSPLMAIFPLGLLAIHLLKRYQTKKVNVGTTLTHEVFDDLKKTK
jgi:acyl phosphate:glycerol-3-phosphate acyltransferase